MENDSYKLTIIFFIIFLLSCSKQNYNSIFDPDNSLTNPSDFSFSWISLSEIKLFWNDNSNWENGFIIDKKISENDWIQSYAVIEKNEETWTDQNVELFETISYRISAFNDDFISDHKIITLTNPPQPKDLNISLETNLVTLTWENIEIQNQNISYNIYKGNENVFNTADNIFSDLSIIFGKEYIYSVSAYFENNIESALSGPLTVVINSYIEDFTSIVPYNWISDSNRWSVNTGKYTMTGSDNNNLAISYYNTSLTNYVLEVEISKVSGNYSAGILLHSNIIDNNISSGYILALDILNKYYSIWKSVNGTLYKIIPWTYTNDLNSTGQINFINVKMEDSNFTFTFNYKESCQINDSTYISGCLGLFSYDFNNDVTTFDNIRCEMIQ